MENNIISFTKKNVNNGHYTNLCVNNNLTNNSFNLTKELVRDVFEMYRNNIIDDITLEDKIISYIDILAD